MRAMPRYTRLFAVLLLLVCLWAVVQFSGLKQQFSLQQIHDGFEHHVVLGLLVFTGLFAIGNLAQLPGWLYLAAAVLTLGQFWGGLATYLAAVTACCSTFWIVRGVGADALREFKGRWATRLFARLDARPIQSVLILRLLFQTVPALNVALALSGVSLRHYLLGTLLGLPLPIAVYSVFFHTLAQWLQWPVPH
jgi:uncharacterized membrane protein YdjX (TVP38/TMEM64 family)